MSNPDGVLLPHGGYERLRSYKVAEAVYDATVVFCDRFIEKRSRPHDQMVQAARSGVRNISEASGAEPLRARLKSNSPTSPARVFPMNCSRITRAS